MRTCPCGGAAISGLESLLNLALQRRLYVSLLDLPRTVVIMIPSGLHYFPVAWPFLVMLAVLFGTAAAVVAVNTLKFASASMGISAAAMLLERSTG